MSDPAFLQTGTRFMRNIHQFTALYVQDVLAMRYRSRIGAIKKPTFVGLIRVEHLWLILSRRDLLLPNRGFRPALETDIPCIAAARTHPALTRTSVKVTYLYVA